jgi:hypothetical protein
MFTFLKGDSSVGTTLHEGGVHGPVGLVRIGTRIGTWTLHVDRPYLYSQCVGLSATTPFCPLGLLHRAIATCFPTSTISFIFSKSLPACLPASPLSICLPPAHLLAASAYCPHLSLCLPPGPYLSPACPLSPACLSACFHCLPVCLCSSFTHIPSGESTL